MQRSILPLNIGLMVLLAAVAGKIASDILAHQLGTLIPATTKSATSSPQPAAASNDLTGFSPIVEKGLFGKATQGKLTPLVAAAPAAATPAAPAYAQGELVLIGTAVGSFRETFALVQKAATREERVFRLGENVFDLGPLLSVKKESIEISINGKKTVISTPSATAAAGPIPHAETPGAGGGLATNVGGGNFVVDQNRLNAALDNIGQAMTDARLLPSMKDGKVEGFKVSEVKPAGVFGMIGLRNGDVLLRMNDLPIDAPDKAIQALAALKGQNHISLDLIRGGSPATFSYDIR